MKKLIQITQERFGKQELIKVPFGAVPFLPPTFLRSKIKDSFDGKIDLAFSFEMSEVGLELVKTLHGQTLKVLDIVGRMFLVKLETPLVCAEEMWQYDSLWLDEIYTLPVKEDYVSNKVLKLMSAKSHAEACLELADAMLGASMDSSLRKQVMEYLNTTVEKE